MFWRPRESGWGLESVYGVTDLKIMSQLGKRCQMGLLGLGFAPGLVSHGSLYTKIYILVILMHPNILHPIPCIWRDRNGWMAMDGFGCHSHFRAHQRYLILDNKFYPLNTYLACFR